ncbi:hypothetical protein CDV36_009543 [Fusarium kuroshium]|uniref:Uncharacterized protein n=1 Tax=Fusarium kuroshium TaxID=2010991 RepID=A0A3M2RZV5_9HYPO|nr:hypothetical protein CDV36_009543 [Fusarium kuroshium]
MQHFQILVASLLGTATAQQLPKYKYDYDFRPFEGITPICKAALNEVLDCDTLLARYGTEGIIPSFKKDIQKACPVESNIVHWPDGSNFTGTDNINEFIDRYNKLCLIDPGTGRFCYDIIRGWEITKEAAEYRCSDCILGLYQIQKESKAEYDESFASFVDSYIDTCETKSVSISIMKGTSTATGTSVSTSSSGAETTPVVIDTSTDVASSPSPEIPVLTPMSFGASTFAINIMSFIVPVLVLTGQWRWFGRN